LGLAFGLFGSGSYGPYTASTGVLTLTEDTYFSAIELSGDAEIDTADFHIYCSGRVKSFGAAKIWSKPSHGGDATGGTSSTGGTAGATPPGGTVLATSSGGGAGTAGANGVSSDSATSSSAVTDVPNGWGGDAGDSGTGSQGGQGYNGNGGSGGAGGKVTIQHEMREIVTIDLLAYVGASNSPEKLRGGAGGRGGGSGQWGDNSGAFGHWRSGAGGGGGGGGRGLWFAFAEYETDETTQPGALGAPGGDGGDGSDATAGDTSTLLSGGGSGGSGAGAGSVYGYIGKRIGGPVEGLIDISGGDGGAGGDAAQGTTPLNQSKAAGGSGAGGGESGQCFVQNLSTGDYVLSRWANPPTAVVPVTATNPPNLVGAAGNPATPTLLDF
jgi:hypothetical protein